jgi:integrase
VPRQVRDASLETRTARARLKAVHKPYFRLIEPGLHLGYRRLANGPGTWVVRRYGGSGKYTVKNLSTPDGRLIIADDYSDADGRGILSFAQAQGRAKAQGGNGGESGGAYTVNQAADDYITYLRDEGRDEPAIRDATWRIDAFIRPALGKFKVASLTPAQLRGWRAGLAKAAPRLRTKADEKQKHREDSDDRARKSSANRILTTLKAVLNHAFDEEKVASNKAWGRRLKPFESADAARVSYLAIGEAKRLLNACDPEFRPLVQAALQSGGRYGQIAALKVSDFNAAVGAIDFRSRKGKGKEKSYSCVLTDEGIQFFKQACAGRAGGDLIFTKDNGEPWQKSHQSRPMAEACERAAIKPEIGFHGLRHTWASHAVMNGTPLLVVAKNLGHSDTRMVEKHYGHLAPSYVSDAIRAGAPRFGFKPGNVKPMRAPR